MEQHTDRSNDSFINRREFVKKASITTGTAAIMPSLPGFGAKSSNAKTIKLDDFQRPDSLYHGSSWESLNPGYWQIKNNSLRRRLKNVGDRARQTGFPYHYETHQIKGKETGVMEVAYDPSLPLGIIWNRNWKLTGDYAIAVSGSIHTLTPDSSQSGEGADWLMFQKGNGVAGIAFGGKTQFESFYPNKNASWMAVIKDDNTFSIARHANWSLETADKGGSVKIKPIKKGDKFKIELKVKQRRKGSDVTARLTLNDINQYEVKSFIDEIQRTDGYPGIAGRGLLDFSINDIQIEHGKNQALNALINECHSCYALGDTLQQENGKWKVRFIAIFRNDGEKAEIRISGEPKPSQGWQSIKPAGSGSIISNDFRRNTAIIDVILPYNPSEKTMYYTIWKDNEDVTTDPRVGTDGAGPGTGMVGDIPSDGRYVGRLPQLKAPYKLCGLSCHAISGGGPKLPGSKRWEGFYVHDQPTYGAYKHLEDYNFQVMLWEDDIWYMELLLYPPSTDDAYKVVTTSICGPTSRWQMMRHWNILNPGDHDHGMDDVKGPEQIAIRNHKDLGQDPGYMIRNFQIVSHLMTGKENPSGKDNPKRWRKWKMPNKDFTLMIMDSRLWRSSQDTNIWDDEGWGHKENLYDRTDPTRSLLGEEQFAWLQENIRTDTSPVICLTGINALHTIWKGTYWGKRAEQLGSFNARDRVAADYAGWVGAGADRILELLGSRDGIVTVYGDVHNGSIIKNTGHNLYECSFGPIGRSGGREVVDGFGPLMKDFDGRELEAIALYHQKYDNVMLRKEIGPFYWNFLEMMFDPRDNKQKIEFKIRNLIDAPSDRYRGGNFVSDAISNTGRPIACSIPKIKTLPDADILFLRDNGQPIRGCRSTAEGSVSVAGLVDVMPGQKVLMVANDGKQVDSQILITG